MRIGADAPIVTPMWGLLNPCPGSLPAPGPDRSPSPPPSPPPIPPFLPGPPDGGPTTPLDNPHTGSSGLGRAISGGAANAASTTSLGFSARLITVGGASGSTAKRRMLPFDAGVSD